MLGPRKATNSRFAMGSKCSGYARGHTVVALFKQSLGSLWGNGCLPHPEKNGRDNECNGIPSAETEHK